MTHDVHSVFPPRTAGRARCESERLHPGRQSPVAAVPDGEQEMLGRWERMHDELVRQGLTDGQARTEAARIAAGEIWDECAEGLREQRAAARVQEAAAIAVALRSIQGVIAPLTLSPGDLIAARRAVTGAMRRLQRNGALFGHLHRPAPMVDRTGEAFTALEAFLNPHRPPLPFRLRSGTGPAAP